MSEYSYDYCLDHDIDYFSIINGKNSHIASNGSIIPAWIDNERNCSIRESVYARIRHKRVVEQRRKQKDSHDILELKNVDIKVDSIKRILLNEGYEVHEITEDVIKDYAASFVEFAELGFNSYDTIGGRLILIAESKCELDKEGFVNDQKLPNSENDEDFMFGFGEDYPIVSGSSE